MNPAQTRIVTEALAETWRTRGADRETEVAVDGSVEAQYDNGVREGRRKQLCDCAEELNMLIAMLTP